MTVSNRHRAKSHQDTMPFLVTERHVDSNRLTVAQDRRNRIRRIRRKTVVPVAISQQIVYAESPQHILTKMPCDALSPFVPEQNFLVGINQINSGLKTLQYPSIDFRLVEFRYHIASLEVIGRKRDKFRHHRGVVF